MVGIKAAPKSITCKHRLVQWLFAVVAELVEWELDEPVCKATLRFVVGSSSGMPLASLWMVAAEVIKKGHKSDIMLQTSADVVDCWLHGANKSSHVAVSEPSYRCN